MIEPKPVSDDEPTDPPIIVDTTPETVVFDAAGNLIWSDDWPSDPNHGHELGGES